MVKKGQEAFSMGKWRAHRARGGRQSDKGTACLEEKAGTGEDSRRVLWVGEEEGRLKGLGAWE